MKLNILNSGIEQPIKASIQDAKSSLNNCKYISLLCPNTFPYSSFVGSLRSKTDKFLSETNKIMDYAKNHENSYDDLFYLHTNGFSNIQKPSLKSRNGLTNKIEGIASYNVTTGSFKGIMENLESKRATKVSSSSEVAIPKLKSEE